MLSIYSSYVCCSRRKEFAPLTEDIQSMDRNRYLVCPYCSSQKIIKQHSADNLKECMQERSYRRVNGALRQK
ncbi:hypothetical protein [Desnuesiella massiliensis]|uniref:hypothetical protein n=1 Tax=Desnuesiella massiliensis TaxID=1650662 RepID=UPI0006E1AA78|nr:hypothetical protein [Desnuesiella massiliensis]